MRLKKIIGLLLALVVAGGAAQAGTDLNEVGAFLVYPLVAAFSFGDVDWATGSENSSSVETFVTITNAGSDPVVAHVAYINGKRGSTYCYECDFDVPLTAKDTETLVVTHTYNGIVIESEDGTIARSCPHPYGFITVNLEDPDTGEILTENMLFGEEVVVEYDLGMALSLPAIPFQGELNGGTVTDEERSFNFDDTDYKKLPRVVAADFLAPDDDDYKGITGALALFTLGFRRQHPPNVDCSVIGYDAAENQFSRSFEFGCWTFESLCDLDPEFCYPNLSAGPCEPYEDCDTHGWLQLNCSVDQNDDGEYEVDGGVHGAIVQAASYDAVIRKNNEYAQEFDGNAAWGRLLYQSVTGGDAVTLTLEGPPLGLD
jgi:hypothetical protein